MEEKITCPLIDNLISPVDCMENQDLKEESIPEKFKKKEDWKERQLLTECIWMITRKL